MEIEDKFEEVMSLISSIEQKLLKKKIVSQKPVKKKNSHIHIMINTEEKEKLMDYAKQEGISFAEWCRKKLKEDPQLDRIEGKIDKIN